MDIGLNIGQSICVGLALADKKQPWLAGELSVSRQFISKVCRGEKDFPLKRYQELVGIFNVPMSKFVQWGEL